MPSRPSSSPGIRDSNRVRRLMVLAVRRVVFERWGKQISVDQAQALAQLGNLRRIMGEIDKQSRIPRKSVTPIEAAAAVALFPDNSRERGAFLHRLREGKSRSEKEELGKAREKDRIEKIVREFRNTAPPYRNFLTRVRRVISHERGRLAMGIADDVAYESGLSQLNELASII